MYTGIAQSVVTVGLKTWKWGFEFQSGNDYNVQCFRLTPLRHMRPWLFRDVSRFRLVSGYRRFGTVYRSHFPGLGSARRLHCFTRDDGTDELYRNVELPNHAA